MNKTERLVYINGEFVPEKDAKVSIFDSALVSGWR
jgi:branched-subunit amino acid aminotransferase/4-amino-4-deoxychorismate lyase